MQLGITGPINKHERSYIDAEDWVLFREKEKRHEKEKNREIMRETENKIACIMDLDEVECSILRNSREKLVKILKTFQEFHKVGGYTEKMVIYLKRW